MKTIAYVSTSFTWSNGKEAIPDNGRNVLVKVKGENNKNYVCFGFYIHPKTIELYDFLIEDFFYDNEWKEYADRKIGYEGEEFDEPEYCWMKEGWWSYDPINEEDSFPLGEIIGWEEIPK